MKGGSVLESCPNLRHYWCWVSRFAARHLVSSTGMFLYSLPLKCVALCY